MSPYANALAQAPTSPWAPITVPGRLTLVSGPRGTMRAFGQELAHDAVHRTAGTVLWCDGDHGFNPYDFAELNLERGFDAEFGADRVLVKRCMTPFQWDTVLTKHVGAKLLEANASLVLAQPYEALFSTDELKDWEQEDYVRYSLKHLRGLARQHKVPILLSVDMHHWWRSHPTLATLAHDAAEAKWAVLRMGEGWRVVPSMPGSPEILARAGPTRQLTLYDFADDGLAAEPVAPLVRRLAPKPMQARLRV